VYKHPPLDDVPTTVKDTELDIPVDPVIFGSCRSIHRVNDLKANSIEHLNISNGINVSPVSNLDECVPLNPE
jgi:hypothetical protein